MSELKLNISKLSEGVHSYNLETDATDLGLDDRFDSTIKIDAILDKSGRQLLLEAKVRTEGLFVCDRCLENFRRPAGAAYSLVYLQESPAATEPETEDTKYISADTNMIDLGEDVRQFLLLALPVKILCQEECKGLCPTCGQNRNTSTCTCSDKQIDPRWEALKNLSDK